MHAVLIANKQKEQEGSPFLTMRALSALRNFSSHGSMDRMFTQDAIERLAFVSLFSSGLKSIS